MSQAERAIRQTSRPGRAYRAKPAVRGAASSVTAPSELREASLALDNLRGLAIAFVLATHAFVAYLASAPTSPPRFDQPPYLWSAFPIVDARRWLGFDIFCAWQDIYLMSLMFFLSGLFVYSSAERDGAAKFLRRRFVRLGLPLAFGVVVVMPVALYPSYRLTAVDPSLAAYAAQYFALPFAPCGPLWFLGVLLALTVAAIALRRPARSAILRVGRLSRIFEERPARVFATWALISIAAYAPLALAFTPLRWVDWGPFAIQLSRPALYAVYYGAGLCVGAVGLDAGLLRPRGRAARSWKIWMAAAALSLLLWMGLMASVFPLGDAAPFLLSLAADAAYGVACACSVLFVLAICLRFGAARRWPLLATLSDNAFAVYVLHYAPIVWLQYALLGLDWPAPVKALVVLAGGGAACLAAIALGRSLLGMMTPRRPAPVAGVSFRRRRNRLLGDFVRRN